MREDIQEELRSVEHEAETEISSLRSVNSSLEECRQHLRDLDRLRIESVLGPRLSAVPPQGPARRFRATANTNEDMHQGS